MKIRLADFQGTKNQQAGFSVYFQKSHEAKKDLSINAEVFCDF